jgi:ABC-type transport system involved in multi-copper enzyme maturation permease subunit
MLLLAQSEKVTNWLTPVWTLSVGVSVGFLIVLVIWGLFWLLGRVRGVNQLHGTTAGTIVALVIAAVVFALLFFGFSWPRGYWSQGDMLAAEWVRHLILMSVFYGGGSLLLGFGSVAAVSAKHHSEIATVPWNGMLYWTSIVCMVAVCFAATGLVLAYNDGFGRLLFVEKPGQFFSSLRQLPETGEKRATVQVDYPTPEGGQAISQIAFDGRALRWIQVKSTQPVEMAARQFTDDISRTEFMDLPASDDYKIYVKRGEDRDTRFPNEAVDALYFNNRGDGPATVTVVWLVEPQVPEASLIVWAAGSVVAFYLAYIFLLSSFPKIFAVAQSTFKTEISQPVFLILLIIGCVFVVASIYIPYNTFGEDIKMYKDSGLTLIRVLGIFMAVWAASKSLAEEIEGRTALTVLSKPVSRRQFILGKYTGIGMTIALLFILIGVMFFVSTGYKPVYDSAESTVRDYAWETCHREAVSTLAGMLLAWLEAMIFAAISVVISTRLGILANFMICFAIYILGHLTPLIVQSAEVAQSFEGVVVFGQLISIIFPVLDHFDINAAITGGVDVPTVYLGWSVIYTALYGLIALLLALVLFEDRDLA